MAYTEVANDENNLIKYTFMKIDITKPVFVVAPTGRLNGIEDFLFCPDIDTANKEVENEKDLSGQTMVVLKCRIIIPGEIRDGEVYIVEEKA